MKGYSLIEALLALSLLLVMGLITSQLYRNVTGTVQFSSAAMQTRQALRRALLRLTPVLQTAYVPPLPGASGCLETPLAPYSPGVNITDPLAPQGPGVNSVLFYAPMDVLNPGVELPPLALLQPHLYELRLLETPDPDPSSEGGPPLLLRTLVVQERQVPQNFGGMPTPLLPGRSRVLARGLSDMRLRRIGSLGLDVELQAQGRQRTLARVSGQRLLTAQLSSKIFFPVVSY